LEDGLFARFDGARVLELMRRLGMPEDEPIEHPWVSKSIGSAQGKVARRARGDLPARSATEWLDLNLG
jgi:preprotein translocase subunit SecA